MTFTEMSLSGAVMAAAVLIIRAAFKNRLPKKIFPLLWEIVLLRLVIPFDIPSAVSVYNFSAFFEKTETPPGFYAQADIPVYPPLEEEINFSREKKANTFKIIRICGTAVLAGCFASAYWICFRRFGRTKALNSEIMPELTGIIGIRRRVSLRTAENISSPLTYGVFRPVILLPEDISCSPEELRFILAHELVHIKRLDFARKLAAAAVLCLHWFNPCVWVAYIFYNRDMELVCDETVIKSLGGDCRREYAMTLIGMEEKRSLPPLFGSFGTNPAEERIKAVMKTKKLTVCTALAAAVIVGGVAAVFGTSPSDKNNDKAYENIIYDEQGNPLPHNKPDYHVNENGETYGSVAQVINYPEDMPDLILTRGDHGIEGYTRRSETDYPPPATPEEAQERERNGSFRVYNVYLSDGVTVIDTFTVGGSMGSLPEMTDTPKGVCVGSEECFTTVIRDNSDGSGSLSHSDSDERSGIIITYTVGGGSREMVSSDPEAVFTEVTKNITGESGLLSHSDSDERGGIIIEESGELYGDEAYELLKSAFESGFSSPVDACYSGGFHYYGAFEVYPEDMAEVCSMADGTAVSVEYRHDTGNTAVISHTNGKTFLYAHLADITVSEGDEVKSGSVIGHAGKSGFTEKTRLLIYELKNGN